MNRFQRRLALIGIVLSTCIGAVHESAGQSSTLTAFYTAPVVSMAPMWIAKEVGFFKKQGLDVKLVFIASGPTGTTSPARGRNGCGNHRWICPDAGNCGRGKDLVIIGQSKTRMTGNIVGKKEIASVQELKGRRLGIDRIGSNPDMFAQAALSRFGIDTLKDLQYVQLGNIGMGIPALKAGTIDALIAERAARSVCSAAGLQTDPRYCGAEDSLCGNGSRFCPQYRGAQTLRAGEVHAGVCGSDALFSDQRGRHRSDRRQIHQSRGPRTQCLCDRV